jgi:adenosylcobinamide-GDP ribazoletransferase
MRRAWDAFRLALACLTIVPVRPGESGDEDAHLAASRYAYPLVGALIGLLLAAMSAGLSALHCPQPIAAFLLVAAAVGITGGLHLDGLADLGDGLFLPGGTERRLAVLRDPHVGSFGVIALVLVLGGKFAALGTLSRHGRSLAILGACIIGRSLVLVAAGLSHYARPEGTGKVIIEATRPVDAILGALVVIAMGFVTCGWEGLGAGLAALATTLVATGLAVRRLGGTTGDVLGTVVELGEMVYLVGLGGGAV